MSFPFSHTHHRRDDDDDKERPVVYPPPGNSFSPFQQPPPFYGAPEQPPPPQPDTHVFHSSHVSSGHVSQHDFNYSAPPPPPPSHHHHHHHHHEPDQPFTHGYSPAPPAAGDYSPHAGTTTVQHVSHETHHHPFHNNAPTSVHHVSHQVSTTVSNKPTVRVFSKAAPNFSLTIRHGQVILAPSDPTNDYQHWYKDEKYSTRVKDSEGCPAFSLINKATGEALKHSIGATHPYLPYYHDGCASFPGLNKPNGEAYPKDFSQELYNDLVRLISYNPDYLDESILWTESRDLGDGHRAIRMVNNVHLNVDAFHGDKKSGGVHDGTTIVLWDWNKGDNQRWKIVPYCKFSVHNIIN